MVKQLAVAGYSGATLLPATAATCAGRLFELLTGRAGASRGTLTVSDQASRQSYSIEWVTDVKNATHLQASGT